MLRLKLVQLLTDQKLDLSGESFVKLARAIVAYSVGITGPDDLRITAKEYGVREEIQQFKNEFLDSSNYITSKFWRAIFAWAKGKSPAKAAKEFDVNEQDIWFAIDMMSSSQLSILTKKVKVAKYVEHPSNIDLNKIVADLRGVAYKVAKYKLRFIYSNDIGTSEDDMAMELITEGIRLINIYDYDNDYKKIRNFAIRGMKNYAIRMIEFHTAKCRQRLVRTKVGGHSKAAQAELKKLNDKQKNGKLNVGEEKRIQELMEQGSTASEFASTTLSIHYPMGDGFTFESILEDESAKRADNIVIEKDFLRTTVTTAPTPIRNVLEILLGKDDQRFDNWLTDKDKQTVLPDEELLERACAFYNVDKQEVQRHMNGVMSTVC